MPAKRIRVRKVKRKALSQTVAAKRARALRRLRGAGFFGDVWSGIKSTANTVNDYAKRTGIVSTALGWIPDPRAKAASTLAKQLGYGHGRMRGGAIRC
jgi:hypothetical protein